MDNDNRSKRRFFGTLSWIIVGLYVLMNVGVILLGLPLAILIITIPVGNILFIGAWFFVRFLYNKANNSIQHNQYLSSKAPDLPAPKYGEGNGTAYTPNLKVSNEQFGAISVEPGNAMVFDMTLKDYMKPGHLIIFHDEMNYGAIKTVQVAKASARDDGIEVSFSSPTR